MSNRKRRSDETYEEYRNSLILENVIDRIKALGNVVWDSKKQGTYKHLDEDYIAAVDPETKKEIDEATKRGMKQSSKD